jgi:hypothetical protein
MDQEEICFLPNSEEAENEGVEATTIVIVILILILIEFYNGMNESNFSYL